MSQIMKQENKKFNIFPLLLCLIIFAGIGVGSYFASKKQENDPALDHTHDHVEENIITKTPEITDVVNKNPEQGNTDQEGNSNENEIEKIQPSSEILYSIKMGDDVCYTLYEEGLLMVTGSGSTYSFSGAKKYVEYLAESLQTTTTAVTSEWLYNVKEIVIEDTITEIGDCSFALYRKTEKVTHYGSPTHIGNNAFNNCGLWCNEGTHWNVDFSQAEVATNAFDSCPNPPEGFVASNYQNWDKGEDEEDIDDDEDIENNEESENSQNAENEKDNETLDTTENQ